MFESLLPADLVVLFRAPWWAEKLYSLCRSHSVPICFDIDDLVFDRQYVTPQYIDHLRRHPEKTAGWQEHADVLLKSIREADFVTVATHALVAAVQEHGKPAYLVPNGFGEDMLAGADAVLKERQQTTRDGRVRIGYASGTKTHQKDFGQAVPAVVRMLADRTNCILTLVGELDLTEFPELTPFMERIEIRPLVPHDKLAWEFGRFDINLAPLDVASPFCQAKSEIKYTEAALVEVPTVASPTEPYRSAIQTNETGFCAETTDDWYRHLLYLVDHPEKRKRMGINGRRHVLARYGPDSKAQLVPRIYSKALSELAHSRRGT